MHAVRRFMLEFIEIVLFFVQTETQLGNRVLCAKSAFVRQSHAQRATRVSCGLIVGFFDLKHVREPLPSPFVCSWYY